MERKTADNEGRGEDEGCFQGVGSVGMGWSQRLRKSMG